MYLRIAIFHFLFILLWDIAALVWRNVGNRTELTLFSHNMRHLGEAQIIAYSEAYLHSKVIEGGNLITRIQHV